VRSKAAIYSGSIKSQRFKGKTMPKPVLHSTGELLAAAMAIVQELPDEHPEPELNVTEFYSTVTSSLLN
jgi:hypothetical protein